MTVAKTPNVHQGIAGLKPYAPGKPIDELARELGIDDIIKLASNENPRGPGERVQAALTRAAADLSRYPDGSGYVLKEALAQHLGVQTAQLTLGNGSNDVLDLIARITVEPGYEAVIPAHSFVVYRLAVIAAGGTLVEVPAVDYGADLAAMEAAITERTRTVFLANPNNPTGTWVTAAALRGFLNAVPERVWVVVDEAYFEYVTAADYPNAISLLDDYPNLLVTRTFSKIYGLASLRLGYAVTSSAVADLLNRVRQPFNCSSLALAAGVAALADQEYTTSSAALNAAGMTTLTAAFDDMGLSYIPSLGNFVSVDCGCDAGEVFQALLQRGVITRPIAEYGLPQHLRVSIGLPEENARFLQSFQATIAP